MNFDIQTGNLFKKLTFSTFNVNISRSKMKKKSCPSSTFTFDGALIVVDELVDVVLGFADGAQVAGRRRRETVLGGDAVVPAQLQRLHQHGRRILFNWSLQSIHNYIFNCVSMSQPNRSDIELN